MNRYFLAAGEWKPDTLELTGDEAKHCARVMRAQEGDEIEVFDGEGKSAVCRISQISRDRVHCLTQNSSIQPPAQHPVTLCQAMPKGSNMDLIIQKSVELGVHSIQPLITTHTVARPDSLEKKRAKWQRIALEACKQCGQNHLPKILEPMSFDHWISDHQNYDTRFIAALDDRAQHLKPLLTSSPAKGKIALLIGPEGDFSPEEYQMAYDANYLPVSFGAIVMRVETASIFGLSILQYELSAVG